ncbi:MAG: hypothetical protein Q9210_003138 [Variospora velana]
MKWYGSMYEACFVKACWPNLMDRARTVKIGPAGQAARLEVRDREEDHIISNPDKEFVKEYVFEDSLQQIYKYIGFHPPVSSRRQRERLDIDNAKSLLRSNPTIKNPKPDDVLAYEERAFTNEELTATTAFSPQASISPRVYFPGLIMEAKPDGGNAEETTIQAARAGTAIVPARQPHRAPRHRSPSPRMKRRSQNHVVFSVTFLSTINSRISIQIAIGT